jgi:hypothetical protein
MYGVTQLLISTSDPHIDVHVRWWADVVSVAAAVVLVEHQAGLRVVCSMFGARNILAKARNEACSTRSADPAVLLYARRTLRL